MKAAAWIWLVSCSAACGFDAQGGNGPDFSAVDFAGQDFTPPSGGDSAAAADLAGLDLAGLDFAELPVDLAGGADLAGAACPKPTLLVSVEAFATVTQPPGSVLRFAIDPQGTTRPCTTLTGQGSLPPQPRAVTGLDANTVAVATTDATVVIDGRNDSIVWTQANPPDANPAYSLMPIDVFPLVSPTQQPLVVTAFANPMDLSQQIARVLAWTKAGAAADDWKLDGVQLPLNNDVYGMTQHRTMPSHLLALQLGASPSAAMDVDPFNKTAKSAITWNGTGKLVSLASSNHLGSQHLVWGNTPSSGRAAADYVDDLNGGGQPSGPAQCGPEMCTTIHAVSDPTQDRVFFAICEYDAASTTGRKVVRFDSFSSFCQLVFDGATLPNTRLSHLGLIE